MKKRNILLFSLIFCLCLTLCACGEKEAASDGLPTDSPQSGGIFGNKDKYGMKIDPDAMPYDFMVIVDHPEMYNECVDGLVTTDLNYVTRVSQNDEGFWIFNVRGIDIPLKQNIWDFITREVDGAGKVHWYLDLKTMTTNLGYEYRHYGFVRMPYELAGESVDFWESTDFSREYTNLFGFYVTESSTTTIWNGSLNNAVFESADGSEEGCAYSLEQIIIRELILENAAIALEDPCAYLGVPQGTYTDDQQLNSAILLNAAAVLYGNITWNGHYVFD